MPRAKPDQSFDIAVRHLFRHINDRNALRRNPLVKSFFEDSSTCQAGQAAVEKIHRRILHVAATCRSRETSHFGSLANRRYEIVEAICSGERPAHTAAKLGLSSRQYYRDRHDICTTVARLFTTLRPIRWGRVEIRESTQLVLRQAALLVEQGFAAKASTLLENAIAQMQSPSAKTLARLSLVKALLQYGDIPRARQSLRAARDFVENCTSTDVDSLQVVVRLASVDLATASGCDAEATLALESLVKRRENASEGKAISDEVGLTIFLESCSLHLLNGRFAEARAALAKARDLAVKMVDISPELSVYLAVYAALCGEDGSAPPETTVSRNYEALRLSLSISSARGAMYAMMGLMRACLRIGNETEAFNWFGQAVEVARAMEGTKPLVSAALAGAELIRTRYWRKAAPLFYEAEAHIRPGTLKWARLQGAQGAFFARSGNLNKALEALDSASDLAGALGNKRHQANMLRERAVVLHQLGRASDSIECIRSAITLAEGGTSALSLFQTYSAAATILSDDRLALEAKLMKPSCSVTGHKRTSSGAPVGAPF